jgi:DNA-binding transcriptional MerR regulator
VNESSDPHRSHWVPLVSDQPPTLPLASPTLGGSEASTKWAQELAGLRQHVNQHSSDVEIQISDIESTLSTADIGSMKARLELLEDLQRNKKSDLESRLLRIEAELQNMKQVQRSNLKTIYDALSAQNLNATPRRSNVGVSGTLMNWIYVLITWFGLGIATMSQPLGAIYP